MPGPIETCAACHFNGADYSIKDALGTLRALGPMWGQTVQGVAPTLLLERPEPGVWSAAEHTAHSADVVETVGRLLHGCVTVERFEVPAPPQTSGPDASDGFDAALARLSANLLRLHDRARRVGGERDQTWKRTATVGGDELDARWLLRHAVHDASHHLSELGRCLHALGAGPPRQVGAVDQMSVSDGGVPKLAVRSAEVGPRGLVGDRQANRTHHGRPLQALCLWSAEVIEALQAEGHPIAAGRAGENVTIRGIEWAGLRPGVQLRIGTVLAEISAWSTPCKKNAPWFVDGDFNRMLHDRHPGTSRAYAWVRQPGHIATGDDVIVEP